MKKLILCICLVLVASNCFAGEKELLEAKSSIADRRASFDGFINEFGALIVQSGEAKDSGLTMFIFSYLRSEVETIRSNIDGIIFMHMALSEYKMTEKSTQYLVDYHLDIIDSLNAVKNRLVMISNMYDLPSFNRSINTINKEIVLLEISIKQVVKYFKPEYPYLLSEEH